VLKSNAADKGVTMNKALMFFVVMFSSASLADIYLCKQSNGVSSYQGSPCDSTGTYFDPNDGRTKKKQQKTEKDLCENADCSGKEYWQHVELRCPKAIESLANYDFEWTDGWTDTKFKPRALKTNKSHIVRFYGDNLRMQNGFGAWSNVIYSCDVDVILGRVVDINVVKGKL